MSGSQAIILKSQQFRKEREPDWRRLDALLSRAERRGAKALTTDELVELPRLYRHAVSSLSVARNISLDSSLITYLEGLSTRGYFYLYGPRTTLVEQTLSFFRTGWPRAAQQSVWAILLAAACLFGGAALGFALVLMDAEWFHNFVEPDLAGGRDPAATTEYLRSTLYDGDGAAGLAEFSATLFTHNAGIALFAFALGFLAGIPTFVLLVMNGLMLGAFLALFASRGLGVELLGWLLIHGVTELWAIIVAGAAGFVLGRALAFPGQARRLDALRDAGAVAVCLAMGAVVMLLIAALIEGFARQLVNEDTTRFAVATATGLLWWLYMHVTPTGVRKHG